MSLVPKLEEVQNCLSTNNVDIGFITETWLKNTVSDSVIDIPGYNVFRKDRTSHEHGGVCIYIKDEIKYEMLNMADCCDDHEILWIKIKTTRLPRGYSGLICAVVYHPPSADGPLLINHLFRCLATIEANYHNHGIIIAGDFNRLNVNNIQRHFKFKQLVKSPTRINAILDLILTNLHAFYSTPTHLPPFGLSDHHTIIAEPTVRPTTKPIRKTISIRDKRTCNKLTLGRYLIETDWTVIDQLDSCNDKCELFNNLARIGLDAITPYKEICINTADAPWMTQRIKDLIKKRQKAFCHDGKNSASYKYYRNAVNKQRKACKSHYYKSNIQDLKGEKPSIWWKEVKRLSGMVNSKGDVVNHLNVPDIENLSVSEKANAINIALLEPMQENACTQDLTRMPLEDNPIFPQVSEERVCQYLLKINPSKSAGPDELPSWFLKEYADIIALPISNILNSSFTEQKLPSVWKLANVCPIPKQKPVVNLGKDLRPISLTSCISKLAEDIIVQDFVKPAALKVIEANQYGGIPNSSTTMALISMIHNWSLGTDGNGATVRTLLFDYRKAFDLIDHTILISKLKSLDLPASVINWVIDFLSNRYQRVKLVSSCFSEWGLVPSGVPQGTKLGPWLFLIMINDLSVDNAPLWKFVDDTTASEVVPKGQRGAIQFSVDQLVAWTSTNKFQLNNDKCKELRITFSRQEPDIHPIIVNDQPIKVVNNAKLLGLNISNNLSWNCHIDEVVKKASKKLYFLVQLKRAKVPITDLLLFYTTCVRSAIDYAVPVFHSSLPKYLIHELERIQKRALSIIYPFLNYESALSTCHISTLEQHHKEICTQFFSNIINNNDHRLRDLLPPGFNSKYNLRRKRLFNLPNVKTNRFKNTFIPAMCNAFNCK